MYCIVVRRRNRFLLSDRLIEWAQPQTQKRLAVTLWQTLKSMNKHERILVMNLILSNVLSHGSQVFFDELPLLHILYGIKSFDVGGRGFGSSLLGSEQCHLRQP